jgi:hypothetical protein
VNYKEICNEGNIGNRTPHKFHSCPKFRGSRTRPKPPSGQNDCRTDREESSPTKNHPSPPMPVGQLTYCARRSMPS